jgi:hypothetical protein
MDPIRTDILESFLTYCTRTQELFKVGQFTGRVETLDAGWDFAPEAEIRGQSGRLISPESVARKGLIARSIGFYKKNISGFSIIPSGSYREVTFY